MEWTSKKPFHTDFIGKKAGVPNGAPAFCVKAEVPFLFQKAKHIFHGA